MGLSRAFRRGIYAFTISALWLAEAGSVTVIETAAVPCNFPNSNHPATQGQCHQILSECSELIPSLVDQIEFRQLNDKSAHENHSVSMEWTNTDDFSKPQGVKYDHAACNPLTTNWVEFGGDRYLQSESGKRCGKFGVVKDGYYKLGGGEGSDAPGSVENSLMYGTRVAIEECTTAEVINEIKQGILNITSDRCAPITRDIASLLGKSDQAASKTLEMIDDKGSYKSACEHHGVKDKSLNFRDYCKSRDSTAYNESENAALTRSCSLNKARVQIEAAHSLATQCEIKTRSESRFQKVAIANGDGKGLWAEMVGDPTSNECSELGYRKGKDKAYKSTPPSKSKGTRHGIKVTQRCIEKRLFPKWKAFVAEYFPKNGKCKL